MSDVLARIAMALVAVVVATGLAIQLHAHDIFASAQERASAATLSPAQAAGVLHDFRRVTRLRPGTQALLAAANLDLRLGRYAAAEAQLAHALRRESRNFAAWATLAVARRALGDRTAAPSARARAHALNPLYRLPR